MKAVKTTTRDEQIEKMFEVIQQKKAEIAKAERPTWKTNCSFCYNQDSNGIRINIQVINDVKELVKMFAHILMNKSFSASAAIELGIEDKEDFLWQGKPVEDWKADFKTRINKIQISKKKAELENLETGLNKLISPEKREELEFRELQKTFEKM